MPSNLKLKYAMLLHNYNQQKLAKLMHVSQAQVSRMLNGVEINEELQKELIGKMERGETK